MDRPRVLVTSSARQAEKLAEELRGLGAEPILLPLIETVAPTTYAPLDAAISRMTKPQGKEAAFHWLLFTSANAVEAFHARLRVAGTAKLDADLSVAAIGAATAGALEAVGLVPSLVPPHAVAESLAEALLPYARQPDGSPTRFLLIRAEAGGMAPPREILPDTLRAAGANVTVVAAYRTVAHEGARAALVAMFSEPSNYPDAITFTSSSAVKNLLSLLAEAGLALPPEIARISIGPVTSSTLREAGLPQHTEAAEASSASIAQAVQVFRSILKQG